MLIIKKWYGKFHFAYLYLFLKLSLCLILFTIFTCLNILFHLGNLKLASSISLIMDTLRAMSKVLQSFYAKRQPFQSKRSRNILEICGTNSTAKFLSKLVNTLGFGKFKILKEVGVGMVCLLQTMFLSTVGE